MLAVCSMEAWWQLSATPYTVLSFSNKDRFCDKAGQGPEPGLIPVQTAPGRGHFFLTTWPWQKITVSFGTLRHHSGNILLWVESFWIFRFWHVWALLFTPQLLLIKLHSLLHMSVLTKLHQQQLLLASWCSSFLKLIKISILDTWDQFLFDYLTHLRLLEAVLAAVMYYEEAASTAQFDSLLTATWFLPTNKYFYYCRSKYGLKIVF